MRSIFEKGGSVADAAIAALFCEGVSLPQSMGLGGGFLLTIYEKKTGTVRSLNAREVAPLAANETMFNGDSSLSQKGAPSISSCHFDNLFNSYKFQADWLLRFREN